MSAAEALRSARAAGVSVGINGDHLVLRAPTPPATAVLDALPRHKATILAMLRPAADGRAAHDWQMFFNVRADRAELEGLPRVQAEARACACCIPEWLNRHPVRSAPGHCLGWGGGDRVNDLVLPFGTEKSGHAWLYSDCWSAWHRLRAPQNDAFEERAAIIEYDAGVPRSWAESFARLNIAVQLPGFRHEAWFQLIDDGGRFLDCWSMEAARVGWSALDVFGVHSAAPSATFDASV